MRRLKSAPRRRVPIDARAGRNPSQALLHSKASFLPDMRINPAAIGINPRPC
jgi:hypothetical protein